MKNRIAQKVLVSKQNFHFSRLKPGPAVMELHGRQSLTKRMLIFQQFMERPDLSRT